MWQMERRRKAREMEQLRVTAGGADWPAYTFHSTCTFFFLKLSHSQERAFADSDDELIGADPDEVIERGSKLEPSEQVNVRRYIQ